MNCSSIDEIINLISNLKIIELGKLICEIEKKFNLKKTEDEQKPKEYFNIYLKNIGDKKINLIKIVKEITNLSLKESKDLIESKNPLIKSNLKKNECDEIVKKITSVGAQIEIK